MKIDYLCSVCNKTKKEVYDFLESLNIQGSIIIANQLMGKEDYYQINTNKYTAQVYFLTDKGVSKSRNFLVKKSNADYVSFLDDDMYFEKGVQEKIEFLLLKNMHKCVRFNVISDNSSRPIKQIKKRGYVSFKDLSSFGVWGCYFDRQFIMLNGIKFREDVGPGTEINHGEDSLFLKSFLQKTKIYSIPDASFHVRQDFSTWQGEDRDYSKELISHGYVYSVLYKKNAYLMSVIHLLFHKKHYSCSLSFKQKMSLMKKGIIMQEINNKD